MPLIGLLTATEKQVPLGRLHMRPIQWHLKRNWNIPEFLEQCIPIPVALHPHLKWWLQEDNVLLGQPLHPLQHTLQLFTDTSREGWGTHLGDHTAHKHVRAQGGGSCHGATTGTSHFRCDIFRLA